MQFFFGSRNGPTYPCDTSEDHSDTAEDDSSHEDQANLSR